MSQAYDIWSTVAGVVGLLTSIPVIYAIVCSQLPSTKLRKLEAALRDTDALLQSVIEEGLLTESSQADYFKQYLSTFRASADQYRDETYMATTFWKEVKGWLTGLSTEIAMVYYEVLKLRARICETSAEARERMQSGNGETRRRRDCLSWYRQMWLWVKPFVGRAVSAVTGCFRTPPQTIASADDESTARSCSEDSAMVLPSSTSSFLSTAGSSAAEKPSRGAAKAKTPLVARSRKARVRALMRVIRQVDQELALLGASHPALSKVVQDSGCRTFHLPGRNAHPRRWKKSSSFASATTTTHYVVALPQSGAEDDDRDSSDEDCVSGDVQQLSA